MQLDTYGLEPNAKYKLLFVDDEPRVLEGLRRILRAERTNWEMTFVGGVDQALEVLAEVDHDAVISDVNMPVRDGLDLLQTIREDARLKDIPVLKEFQPFLENLSCFCFVRTGYR